MKVYYILPLFLWGVFGLWACQSEPKINIAYGQTECEHCKMNITEQKFATVAFTRKGKQYAFDALECLVPWLNEKSVPQEDIDKLMVADYLHPGQFLEIQQALYVESDSIRSPMGGHIAAFANETDRSGFLQQTAGTKLDWQATQQRYTRKR